MHPNSRCNALNAPIAQQLSPPEAPAVTSLAMVSLPTEMSASMTSSMSQVQASPGHMPLPPADAPAPPPLAQLLLHGRRCNVSVVLLAEYNGEHHLLLCRADGGEWSVPSGKVLMSDVRLGRPLPLTHVMQARKDATPCAADKSVEAFVFAALRHVQNKSGIAAAEAVHCAGARGLVLHRESLNVPESDQSIRTELVLVHLGHVASLPAPDPRCSKQAHWVSQSVLAENMRHEHGAKDRTLYTYQHETAVMRHVTWAVLNGLLTAPVGGSIDQTPGGFVVDLPINYQNGYILLSTRPGGNGWGGYCANAGRFIKMKAGTAENITALVADLTESHLIVSTSKLDLNSHSNLQFVDLCVPRSPPYIYEKK